MGVPVAMPSFIGSARAVGGPTYLTGMGNTMDRAAVLRLRVRAQQLDHPPEAPLKLDDVAILDIGVQDTGPDGGLWALALRGVDVSGLPEDDLALAWTLRGAPHLYRRRDLAMVATAVQPYSEADAAKRIFDAAKPLREAGIGILDALDTVATEMRRIVTKPMVKGDVSTRLTARLDKPYLRFCRACNAIHSYELTFRLAALRGGLELQPGTSPPVLQRIPGFRPAANPDERFDVVRAYLRLLGPATVKQVAEYVDAPVKEVKARWPADAVEVRVDGETRWMLGDATDPDGVSTTRLLGPFDLFLQARDRSTLVPDPARAKALWPVLGRPGAVLVDGEIVGMWRPRQSGSKLTVRVEAWSRVSGPVRRRIGEEAERLAAFRDSTLIGVELVA